MNITAMPPDKPAMRTSVNPSERGRSGFARSPSYGLTMLAGRRGRREPRRPRAVYPARALRFVPRP